MENVEYKEKKSIFLVLLPKQAQQKPCKVQKDKPQQSSLEDI